MRREHEIFDQQLGGDEKHLTARLEPDLLGRLFLMDILHGRLLRVAYGYEFLEASVLDRRILARDEKPL